jgi:hypothetical protein
MLGGGGRPDGGCSSRGGEDGGDGAAGRVGEDPWWAVSAVGVSDGRVRKGGEARRGRDAGGADVPSAAGGGGGRR